MLCISSGTNDLWPHHFDFPLQFLFVSHYQDSFSKTHNHLCYRSYHSKTLTAVSSSLLLNVHTWIHVLSEFTCWCLSYIYCVFVFSEWLNLSKIMAFYVECFSRKTVTHSGLCWSECVCQMCWVCVRCVECVCQMCCVCVVFGGRSFSLPS